MSVQVIEKEGKPEFAVLPFQEYETLLERLEDLEDARDLQEYRANPDESLPAAFADRLLEGENPIKLWREYRGMTQRGLAERVKVTVAHISQIESGKRECSVKLLRSLSKALNADIELLLLREESDQ
jgi:DNA-binding XRE family transcriptional regulator